MYTFLPAMAGASVELLKQAIQEMKERYNPQQFAKHLARFKTILQRSRTLSEEEKQAVEEYMQVYDSLIDNDPYFQQRLEQKMKEVAEIAAREALEREVRGLQALALEAVQDRFPLLAEYARKQVLFVKQPEELRRLVRQIYKAPDEATARWLLGTFSD
jgi:hypothetical protein